MDDLRNYTDDELVEYLEEFTFNDRSLRNYSNEIYCWISTRYLRFEFFEFRYREGYDLFAFDKIRRRFDKVVKAGKLLRKREPGCCVHYRIPTPDGWELHGNRFVKKNNENL